MGDEENAAVNTLTADQIRSALASMSLEERQALLGLPVQNGPGTPKMSATLDKVAPEKIDACLAMLGKAKKVEGDPAALGAVLADMTAAFPAVVAAMQTNSGYRRKPLGHSVSTAIVYLTQRKAA